MKLEKIKLSGFKSFVDPTVIPIHGNLTAIVGPNGCGKSNIIDAIRWVMGESSAKHLRGGSMADVIFNGSSSRKPVSTASVELVFDNSEGKIGGEYAQYNSIAIKRQVSRDGQSLYLLNGARCRRKDITDIFLGTGLGSRSYAIIEQGTISRMVEAKPEELRIHIEEAAGISKYKERRSETETRMKHTRENLERLDDLRDEVDKQIKHLQKQAEKAEKYTELKKQERQYKLELLAMRWQIYHQAAQDMDAKLQEVALEHNRLFTNLRELSTAIENKRTDYKTQQQQINQVQSDYYTAVAEVGRLEQTIRFNETSHEEALQEINRSQQQASNYQIEIGADLLALDAIKKSLLEAEAALKTAGMLEQEIAQSLKDHQQQKNAWQQQWENHRTESSQYKEQGEIQRVKINQLESQNQQLQIRMDKLHAERSELSAHEFQHEIESLTAAISLLENQRADFHAQLENHRLTIAEHREQVKHFQSELHSNRTELQHIKGKITSLELLQQHAMGKDNKKLNDWLTKMGLNDHRRLAEFLDVAPSWETAVETVLEGNLEAICTDNIERCIPELGQLDDSSLSLFETTTGISSPLTNNRDNPLLAKVSAPWDLSGFLSGIYCADNIESGRELSRQLKPHESVITQDGTWFGPGWVCVRHQKDTKSGVLQREKELRQTKLRQEVLQAAIETLEDQAQDAEHRLKEIESNRETIQQQNNELGIELSQKQSEASAINARLDQHQRRLIHIDSELETITDEITENAEKLMSATALLREAEAVIAKQEGDRLSLDRHNEVLQDQHQDIENAANEARQKVYSIKAQLESLHASETLTAKQVERLQSQQEQALNRIAELKDKLELTLAPIDGEKKQLEQLTQNKRELETQLKNQRQLLDEIEAQITQLSENHQQTERELEKQREKLDALRLDLQESKVRQQSVNEQLNEINADAEEIIKTLPEEAEEPVWKRKVDELTAQIERLGTINLTAIEEFQAQSERMEFLNEQHADLTEALNTLDQAISKIDRESKLRFQETFDKINAGLQDKFPRLFGGGQAYLQLSEDDLLESGVNIIARPPGKRNSSIHLLSGGEKALTAVALVFSIFDLNPAPFCLLDEVDAPLDDANVVRFSQMVEDMSESIQFLYISHNKVTMEIAKQLAGVTMKEPGVSRMVAVDIDEAVSLAES
ncbi:chromosome partition protein Smc [Methyloglobulus morosus KoM1]|uniref:Chromosome partition protein Smc n=1 Tax=Methyloglobulus morosus KoM1 TaxID=1116472 RepID=V5C1M3_9GAMM|nr:chromosome segregation protein SMC [Methyloglobulus morosus]ESS72377.1 chromosome partition protein Smc [Methyloglobulus morosus KoM1]